MDKKINLSYEEICKVIGHLILSSHSEITELNANFSILLSQLKEQISNLQTDKASLLDKLNGQK